MSAEPGKTGIEVDAMQDSQYQNKHAQLGLSLIEVMGSLLLLTLMAFGILAIFSPVTRWIIGARHETTAINMAAAIIENLRSERDKIDPLNVGKTVEEIGLPAVEPAPGMEGKIILMQALPAYPNLYQVVVTVTWSEGIEPHGLSLSTVVRKE